MKIHNDIEEFVKVNPVLYRFLKGISFSRQIGVQGCTGYSVEIVLSKISGDDFEDIRIRCINAVDIKIGEIESMFGMWVGIEDIGFSQLEGVSYRVSERENNTFSFACSDFFVDLIR